MREVNSFLADGGALILVALCGLLATIPAFGQTSMDATLYSEIVFLRGTELGSSGRALALGGAYRALSDDLSGLYWNPAGLASVRRIEMSLGLAQMWTRDETEIGPSPVTDQLSRTRLNELGLVFPIPTYRGSLVFALGYHQVHNFDSFGTFRTSSSDSSFQADELESGRLGLWSLGMAIDLSEVVSAGLALRLWTGYDNYSWNAYTEWSSNTWSRFDQTINTNLMGFNVITGVLLKPLPGLRLGATLETPLKLKNEESYQDHSEWSSSGQYGSDSFAEDYTYHVSRSFRSGVGAAVLIKQLGLSADVVLNDWSQISYGDEPPFSGLSRDEADREVARRLRTTVDFHFGLEYWLPFIQARAQLGYAYIPSPFNNDTVLGNKNIFSGGLGILLDPSLHVQGAVSYSQYDRSLGGWDEKLQMTHLLITLSYRF